MSDTNPRPSKPQRYRKKQRAIERPDLLTQACTHCDGGGFEPMGGRFKDSHACSVCGGEGEIRSHAIDLRAMLGDRYEALASAISETVSDWIGHDTPYSPHGWRCEDKTRYPGPCGHDGDMTGEVMGVLEAILPDLLAQAWDEGYKLDWTGGVRHPNPYRQETTA